MIFDPLICLLYDESRDLDDLFFGIELNFDPGRARNLEGLIPIARNRITHDLRDNQLDKPRDTDLRGSARLSTSMGDLRHSLLLEIPIIVQALTVSLTLSQFHHHYNALTTQ